MTTDVANAVDVTHSTDVCVYTEVKTRTGVRLDSGVGAAWIETVLVEVRYTTDVRGLSVSVVVKVEMGVSGT